MNIGHVYSQLSAFATMNNIKYHISFRTIMDWYLDGEILEQYILRCSNSASAGTTIIYYPLKNKWSNTQLFKFQLVLNVARKTIIYNEWMARNAAILSNVQKLLLFDEHITRDIILYIARIVQQLQPHSYFTSLKS